MNNHPKHKQGAEVIYEGERVTIELIEGAIPEFLYWITPNKIWVSEKRLSTPPADVPTDDSTEDRGKYVGLPTDGDILKQAKKNHLGKSDKNAMYHGFIDGARWMRDLMRERAGKTFAQNAFDGSRELAEVNFALQEERRKNAELQTKIGLIETELASARERAKREAVEFREWCEREGWRIYNEKHVPMVWHPDGEGTMLTTPELYDAFLASRKEGNR